MNRLLFLFRQVLKPILFFANKLLNLDDSELTEVMYGYLWGLFWSIIVLQYSLVGGLIVFLVMEVFWTIVVLSI